MNRGGPLAWGSWSLGDLTVSSKRVEEPVWRDRFLGRMMEKIRDHNLKVDSVLVIRHGYLVFETYAATYDRSTIHNLKSASKSILSALVGVALRDKLFTGLDERVSDILPEYYSEVNDPRKKGIRLRHLLTMTAGIDLTENSPEFDKVFQSPDWIRSIVDTPLNDEPGRTFNYNTVLTHLMSAALTRRTGVSAQAFAQKTLFAPLGVGPCLWRKDPQGNNLGGSEMFLTPRDMAKFGYLILKKGYWKGRSLVPQDWVAESTKAQVKTQRWQGLEIDDYGSWWWLPPGGAAALPPNDAAARAISALLLPLEHPQPETVGPLPALAHQISGRTFQMDPNPLGLTSFRLEFSGPKQGSLVLGVPGGNAVWPVGLDGVYRLSTPGSSEELPVACRGSWTNDNPPLFLLDYLPVGEPIRVQATFEFRARHVVITALRTPMPIRLELAGTEVR